MRLPIHDPYQLAEILSDNPEAVYLYEAERFGAGHSKAIFEVQINEDGSARVIRIVEVEAYSTIETLDAFLLFPSSNKDQDENLQLNNIRSFDPARDVTYKKIESQPVPFIERLAGQLEFSPPLQEGERIIYEMREEATSRVFELSDTKDKLPASNPYEFFGWTIYRPTRHLKLTVRFPNNETIGTYFAQVRRANSSGIGSADIQHAETKTIGRPTRNIRNGLSELTIEIDFPMMGLVYMLRWEPKAVRSSTNLLGPSQRTTPLFLPSNLEQQELAEKIERSFNLNELDDLCFSLGISIDNVPGSTKSDKCRELVTYYDRRGRLSELVSELRRKRPTINWNN